MGYQVREDHSAGCLREWEMGFRSYNPQTASQSREEWLKFSHVGGGSMFYLIAKRHCHDSNEEAEKGF